MLAGSWQPTRDTGLGDAHAYTKSEALLRHALAVEASTASYARQFGEDEELWRVAALLHDFDYEIHPTLDKHPQDGAPILREEGYPEEVIEAVLSHAKHLSLPRDTPLKKALFACDELSGFVHACGLVRPTGLEGLEPKSVKKKLKQPSFAAGVHRDDVYEGAELLELDLDEHIANVVAALQPIAAELGLRTQPTRPRAPLDEPLEVVARRSTSRTRRATSPGPGSSRTMTPRLVQAARRAPPDRRRRNETSVAWPGGSRPRRCGASSSRQRAATPPRARSATRERRRARRRARRGRRARPARVEPRRARLRARTLPRWLVRRLREVATGGATRSASGSRDVERAGRVRRRRATSAPRPCRSRARRRRPRSRRPTARRRRAPARPSSRSSCTGNTRPSSRARARVAISLVRGVTAAEDRVRVRRRRPTTRAPLASSGPDQAEVLRVGRHDLVVGREPEAGEDDVAAVASSSR